MKKNLLIAALVLPLLSVSAQWNQTGGTVTVKAGTLKYVQQNYSVAGTSKTLNSGNVNVRGDFSTVQSFPNGQGFHNLWSGRNEYGQLIIQNGSATTGEMENQYNLPSGLQFIPITFPFKAYLAADAATDLGITATYVVYNGGADDGFMPGRYNSTFWTWNNAAAGDASSFFFENIGFPNTQLNPEEYHGINNMGGTVSGTKGFFGVPQNNDIAVTANPYDITTAWDVNDRGELYASYVEDVAVEKPTGWRMATTADNEQEGVADGVDNAGYGDNISLFGNPFTSNMQLTGSDGTVSLANVTHVFYIANNSYTPDVQGQSTTAVYVTTFDGGSVATGEGVLEAEAVMVRPQETFFVKTNGSAATLNLSEATKTFTPKTTNYLATSRINSDNGFYQVSLQLFNDLGENTNAKAYVFASDVVHANERSQFEAYNTAFGNLGFYSLQENADGTVYQQLADQKVLINGVNASEYVAKPIHMVFAGTGEFTVKGLLSQNLINSGNKFYFEDRQTGDIFEVTEDFAYTFSNEGTATDRFFMYWNGLPETLAVDDVALTAQTVVYRDAKEFKVRFARTWNKADVYVYNMLGQLVHTAKGLDTSNDYLIPLKGNAAAYVVKAISSEGEVSTQKIVKQ